MKKDKIFEVRDLATLVEKHNPFGIKGIDGRIEFFETYRGVYFYVMNVLHTQFKKGYVDMILLVNVLTRVNASACEEVFKNMRSLWGNSPERLIDYHFDSTDPHSHGELALIMKCLHTLSETKFDEYEFQHAVEMMQLKLARENEL